MTAAPRRAARDIMSRVRWFAALDEYGVVWGLGPSPDQAREDARYWLSETATTRTAPGELEIIQITHLDARQIEAGTVGWSLGLCEHCSGRGRIELDGETPDDCHHCFAGGIVLRVRS